MSWYNGSIEKFIISFMYSVTVVGAYMLASVGWARITGSTKHTNTNSASLICFVIFMFINFCWYWGCYFYFLGIPEDKEMFVGVPILISQILYVSIGISGFIIYKNE